MKLTTSLLCGFSYSRNLRLRIKGRRATNYSGEDVKLLSVDFRHDALELVTASQYKHNLTLAMLKIFLLAGGANNGNFQFPLRLLKKELNKALLVIPHMSRSNTDRFMIKKGLTYKDICTLALGYTQKRRRVPLPIRP
jgi:hypothetical protein